LLFTGAGFSFNTVNVDDVPPPDSKGLALQISKLAGIPEDDDLKYVSDYYLKHSDSQALIGLLTRLYTIKNTTAAHSKVSSACWRRIYTTNYDNTVELSARSEGVACIGVTTADSPNEYVKRKNICVHINGSIDRLTTDSLDSDFKLSRSSYASSESFIESSWHYSFKRDLEWCSGIFFVGYSLYDIEIEKLLHETPEYKDKTFFIIGENPTPKEIFILSKYGTVLPISVAGFSKIIESVDYTKSTREFWLDSSVEREISETEAEISDNEIWDFLLYGRLSSSHIDFALTGQQGKPYLVVREDVSRVAQYLMGGKPVVVHSEFGNGKTVFLNEVASYLTMNGRKAFLFNDEDGDYISDIDKIAALGTKAVLIVDGYTKHSDLISYYATVQSPLLSILMSDRTYAHERSSSWLVTKLPSCLEYGVDILTDAECEHISAVVKNIGKWERPEAICKDNDRQISHILLSVFDAPQIRDRISTLTSKLFRERKIKDTVFAICLLEVMNFPRSKSLISEVAGNDEIYSAALVEDKVFQQLFMPHSGNIELRSSLFAIHVIKHHLSPSYITDKLLASAAHFNGVQDGSYVQKEIFKSLMRFSFIERLLPNENKRNSLVKFYDELKIKVGWLTSSPHYWLQYAMARMTFRELDKAEAYLKQAYDIAGKKDNYDTSYLDAQQARLYLLIALEQSDSGLAYELFSNANRLLVTLDNDTYKFRQVLSYEDIHRTSYPGFSNKQKVAFEHACNKMLGDASNPVATFQSIRGESIISQCKAVLERIKEEIVGTRR
jgi:hypothetical protein